MSIWLMVLLLAIGGGAAYLWYSMAITGKNPLLRTESSFNPQALQKELERGYDTFIAAIQERDQARLNGVISVSGESTQERATRAKMNADFDAYAGWMQTLNPARIETTFVTVKRPSTTMAAYFFIWYPPDRGSINWYLRGGTERAIEAKPLLSMRLFNNENGQWRMPFYQLIDPGEGVPLPEFSGEDLLQAALQRVEAEPQFELSPPETSRAKKGRRVLSYVFSLLPLALVLLFTLLAYQDLKMARDNTEWYTVKGKIVLLDSDGNLTYDYKVGGYTYHGEYYDFQEYVGNCMHQSTPPTPNSIRPELPRCSAAKAWLRKLHGFIAPIPGWKRASTEEEGETLTRVKKERATKLSSRLSEGENVRVYYHPDNPAAAVLKPYQAGEPWNDDPFKQLFYLALGATTLMLLSLLPSLLGLSRWGEALVPVVIVITVIGYFYSFRPDPYLPTQTLERKLATVIPNESGWEKTTATVSVSYVARRLRAGHGVYTYYPSILYKYVVYGVNYSGLVIPGNEAGTPQEVVERYPEGLEVEIWYDPRHPNYSTLHPGRVVYEKR